MLMRRYLLSYRSQNYPRDGRKGTRSTVLHFTMWIDAGRAKSGSIRQEIKALLLSATRLLANPQLESFNYRKTLTEWYGAVLCLSFRASQVYNV